MKKFLNAIRLGLVSLMSVGASVQIAFADKFGDSSEAAATGIQNAGVSVLKGLLIIFLVVGGVSLGFGTQKQQESVKERFPMVVIGGIMIVSAVALAGVIFSWF